MVQVYILAEQILRQALLQNRLKIVCLMKLTNIRFFQEKKLIQTAYTYEKARGIFEMSQSMAAGEAASEEKAAGNAPESKDTSCERREA